jgi:ubiquinone/menaquinone biosynthesis C-methylase UbiE
MTHFDEHARDWDKNEMHLKRSISIATSLEKMLPLRHSMRALEYGAGTGLLSFLLKDKLSDITLMDNSKEMIMVCEDKADYYKTRHIHPIWFDLEHSDYNSKGIGFDLIYSQMVFHHVKNIESILIRFYTLLNPGGYLAIADLYTEDGSFHGTDIVVHNGFDPAELIDFLGKKGFKNGKYETCFEIEREPGRKYPVFLLVTNK